MRTRTGLWLALAVALATAARGQVTVLSVDPPNGATDVAVDESVIVTFSAQMATASVEASFSLTDYKGRNVLGVLGWIPGTTPPNSMVTFSPQADLSGGQLYRVFVGTTAQSITGSRLAQALVANFTTAQDPPVPVVSGTIPEAAAEFVDLTQNVTVMFSQPMDTDATDAAISLAPANGAAVDGTTIWSEGDMRVLFVPVVTLRPDTLYTINVSAAATSAVGVSMAVPYSGVFQTAPAPSPAGPPGSPKPGGTSTLWLLISLTIVIAIVVGGVLAGVVFAYRSKNTIDTFAYIDSVPEELRVDTALLGQGPRPQGYGNRSGGPESAAALHNEI